MKIFIGIALGLLFGYSAGSQNSIKVVSCPTVESSASVKEIEPKIETPKFLGPYKRGRTGVMHAQLSFYDLGPGSINVDEYMDGKTSIGRKAIPGRTIAVDPKVIPYGSKVFIPGFGWRVAEDTGGAIKGNRIDILVEDEEKAFRLGRKSELVLWTK